MLLRSMVLLATLVALIAAAGCGADDDDASGESGAVELTASSLTKAQYVEKANEACFDVRSKLQKKINDFKDTIESPAERKLIGTEQYPAFVEDVLLPDYEAELAAVRALGAPSGEEARLEALLTAQQEGIDEVTGQDAIESFEPIELAFARGSRMALDYGLSECAVSIPPENGGS